jgi:CubicO group peptidase (beta-lactamase class C family)
VAVRQGMLGLDDSICKHLTQFEGQDACRLTVRHVLTFTSGLDWNEGYENAPYQESSVIAMLFGVGHHDALSHVLLTHKLTADPGTRWSYSTGDAVVVASLAKAALSRMHGPTAFWTQLFDKLGTKRVVFEEDAKGAVQGGSLLYATPRDFARFGHLMMRDGCWNGQRLLPEGWVRDSLTVSPQFATRTLNDATERNPTPNGYSWWVNQPTPSRGWARPWPDAPPDTFAAIGHWGQFVLVVPSEQVVIVRTGDDRNASMRINDIIKYALPVTR